MNWDFLEIFFRFALMTIFGHKHSKLEKECRLPKNVFLLGTLDDCASAFCPLNRKYPSRLRDILIYQSSKDPPISCWGISIELLMKLSRFTLILIGPTNRTQVVICSREFTKFFDDGIKTERIFFKARKCRRISFFKVSFQFIFKP